MASHPSRAAGKIPPLLTTQKFTDVQREQLRLNARHLQQLLCTTAIRKTHGGEECQVMLFALDLCLNSRTPDEADTDLLEITERITRIIK